PSETFRRQANVSSKAQYEELYRESLTDPDTFWRREAGELCFRTPWSRVTEREPPFAKWFLGATLNASESCLDRFRDTPTWNKDALIWESEDGYVKRVTYAQLHERVVRFAAALRELGVNKGDRVVLYMGMVPEAVIGMLACARVGALHSVVFGGFAADSLRDRINDCQAKVVLTQDAAPRRGKPVPLKTTVDAALEGAPSVEHVVVLRRMGVPSEDGEDGRVRDWATLEAEADSALGEVAEVVDGEHPLFI